MDTITITKGKDVIIMTRQEYEAFLALKRVRNFVPTVAEKSALKKARADYRQKKYLSIDDFERGLAGKNS